MANDLSTGMELEVPPSYLRVCILLAVAERAGYGYELALELPALGAPNARVHTGMTYRALHQLEREGLVQSHWDRGESGPPRRVYTITTEGANRLDQAAPSIEALRRGMTRFLRRYRKVTAATTDPATPAP